MIKHPALAIIPPNATITKAKSLSMGTKLQMQTAAGERDPTLALCKAPPALAAASTHLASAARGACPGSLTAEPA